MSEDKTSPIIIEIAKDFMTFVISAEPDWKKAYLRFSCRNSVSETKGSISSESGVEIIDTVKHRDFFYNFGIQGRNLMTSLGESDGLFLLVIDSNFNYEIKFEHKDMNRWKISKLNNGTGIPDGIE